ncbi:hypothetical protein N7478_012884 [Penicillium angulare]|uniref:uncharacterized protein n=1 Tax=Penicillium angulare TaxID=116970 RepID=UPI0025404A6D|nr:uncharacterized protein N7478_012884 [Penicillium angulare]KAJ5256780.1 hypothetical protein N7478_012884 [Penicillium angulare]
MAWSTRPNVPNPELQEVTNEPAPTRSFANLWTPEQKPKLSTPLLLFNDGDTLLFIDSGPARQYCTTARGPTIPHRVHSEKLLATDSAYFTRLFQQRSQKRFRKQRGYEDRLPDGIKYVVDLTPETLDEDAVIILTEVSCPMTIRTWASYQYLWDLPYPCVGGEDELELTEVREPVDLSEPLVVRDEAEDEDEDEGIEWPENRPKRFVPWYRENASSRKKLATGLPVEYSAARHREGIENVLNVLEGLPITLDTPCKLWTFFAVAKLYDVATVPSISGYIVAWFYERHNTRFIELHPEIAYRVALGIKSATLCRDAFVGLVSDEALLYLIRSALLKPIEQWKQSFKDSRMKDVLDDTEVQRIEYASKAFADDIINHFLHLVGEEMAWFRDVPEFTKITQHLSDHPEDKQSVRHLIISLKNTVRNILYRTLSDVGDPVRFCDAAPSDKPRPYYRAFLQRDLLVRLMGAEFWTDLALYNFDISYKNYRIEEPGNDHLTIADIGYGLLAFQGQGNASIRGVMRRDLAFQIQDFNDLTSRRARQKRAVIERQKTAITSNAEQHRSLPLRLRQPYDQPYDETEIFPMDTILPERSAKGPDTGSSSSPRQSITRGFASIMNPANTDASNEAQSNVPHDASAFDLDVFITSAMAHISRYAQRLVYANKQSSFHPDGTDLLTCLTDNEWQYLPLWAGGNDDETGGVFTDHEIPIVATGGFSAPGPSVHTSSTAPTNDSFSEINSSEFQSTIQGASNHATYSHASDILSMRSFTELDRLDEVEEPIQQASASTFDDPDSEEDFDAQSIGPSTVVMSSPSLSGLSDDDDDEDDDGNDIDMIESEDEFSLMET